MKKKTTSVNQARGPRVGNAGNAEKRAGYLAEKAARTSYLGQIADKISAAFGRRGAAMMPDQHGVRDADALKSISPVTRTRRGPTRGNR